MGHRSLDGRFRELTQRLESLEVTLEEHCPRAPKDPFDDPRMLTRLLITDLHMMDLTGRLLTYKPGSPQRIATEKEIEERMVLLKASKPHVDVALKGTLGVSPPLDEKSIKHPARHIWPRQPNSTT